MVISLRVRTFWKLKVFLRVQSSPRVLAKYLGSGLAPLVSPQNDDRGGARKGHFMRESSPSLLVPQQPIVPDQLPFPLSTSHLAMGLVHLTRSAPSLLRLAAPPPSPHNLRRRLPPILPGPFPFYDPRSPGPSSFFRPHPRVHAAASGTNQQSLSEPRNGMEYVLGTLRSRTGRGREVSGL